MFVKNKSIYYLSNILNISYSIASFFLIFGAILYLNNLVTNLVFLLFIFITNILIWNKKYIKNHFSILYTLYSLFFLLIPLSYILFNKNYIFGTGLLEIPFDYKNIRKNLAISIIQLTLYWICIWFTIYIISNPKKIFKQDNLFVNVKYYEIVLLISIIGIIVSIYQNINAVVLLKEGIADINIFRFLFADHAIIVYSATLFFYLKNQSNFPEKNLNYKFLLLLILFFINFYFFQHNKSPIYLIIIYIFISMISYNRYKNFKIIFPNYKFLFLIIFITLVGYDLMQIYRTNLPSYDEFSHSTFLEILKNYSINTIFFEKIIFRLANGGLEQFLLINESFSHYNFTYSLEFAVYMLKNFINMMLPGTIYVESYVPSSQLFNDVILKKEIYSQLTKIEFSREMNTQPFTPFGLSIILFGKYLSYIAVTLYFFLIQKLSICIKNKLFKATMGFIFFASLIIYSFETMIAEAIMLFFQLYFIHIVVKSLSNLFSKITKKSTY